jgi:hypothetical protein
MTIQRPIHRQTDTIWPAGCTMNAFIILLWKDEFLKLLLRFRVSFNPFCEQWMLSEIFSRAYRNCRRPEIGWFKTDCRLAEKYEESTKRTVCLTKRGIIHVLELLLKDITCNLFFCLIGCTSGEIFPYWLFSDTNRMFFFRLCSRTYNRVEEGWKGAEYILGVRTFIDYWAEKGIYIHIWGEIDEWGRGCGCGERGRSGWRSGETPRRGGGGGGKILKKKFKI